MIPKNSIPPGPFSKQPEREPVVVESPPQKQELKVERFPSFEGNGNHFGEDDDYLTLHDLVQLVSAKAEEKYGGWYRFRVDWNRTDLSSMPKQGRNSTNFYGEMHGVLLVGRPEVIGDEKDWPVEVPNIGTVTPENVTDPGMLPHLLELLVSRCMCRCFRSFVGNRRCAQEELATITPAQFQGTLSSPALQKVIADKKSEEQKEDMPESVRQVQVALKTLGLTEAFLGLRFHASLSTMQPGQPESILRVLRQLSNEQFRDQVLREILEKHGTDEYARCFTVPTVTAKVEEKPKEKPKAEKKAKVEAVAVVRAEPAAIPQVEPSKQEVPTGSFFGGVKL